MGVDGLQYYPLRGKGVTTVVYIRSGCCEGHLKIKCIYVDITRTELISVGGELIDLSASQQGTRSNSN